MKTEITQEFLKSRFLYNEETGDLTYIKNNPKRKAGEKAGQIKNSYVVINIRGRFFLAHRLAWMYVYGSFPSEEIDHIDGNKSNNSIKNLREANHRQNMENRRAPHSNNSCGFLGVQKIGDRFRAKIAVNGVLRHLGMHSTPEEAHATYLKAKRELHEFNTI